jgi:hypothetical protein
LRPVLFGVLVVLMTIGAARLGSPVQVPAAGADRPSAPVGRQTTTGAAAPVTSTVLVCPGPEQQGLTDATVPEQVQRVTVTARSSPLAALPAEVAAQVGPSAAGASGELLIVPTGATPAAGPSSRGSDADVVLEGAQGAVVQARGPLAAGVAATQVHLSLQEQSRGLEVTPCLPPAEESWLLAGGGQAGRLERLVLLNPGTDPVTATVTVLDRDRSPDPRDGADVVVPGGGRMVRLIDAGTERGSAPAVRVSTAGDPVAAFLADRWLQGSTDRGLELTTPTSPPARRQVIPGVVRAAGSDARTRVRVAVPGAEQAVVQIRALTRQGPVRLQQDVTLVSGGRTQDIEVSDLPPGRHGLEVSSDVDVVVAASAQTEPGAAGAGGLAWSPATPPLHGLAGLVLDGPAPEQTGRVLQLTAVQPAAAEVVVVDDDGSVRRRRIELTGQDTSEVALGQSSRDVWVRPLAGQVHAAVVWELTDPGGDLLAVAPLPGLPLLRPVTSVEPVLP